MTFEVTIDSTTSGPIQEGDTYEVTALVTNTGASTDTQTIELYTQSGQGGTLRDDSDQTIDPGDTVQVTLTWNTTVGDAGNYEVSVESEDPPPEGVDTSDITVEQPPTAPAFPVTVQTTNSPVTVGGTLTVTALVENSGEQAATQQVSLSVGGQQRDATDVTLENGQSTEVTLAWATGSGDAGSYEAVVASETNQDSTGVTVEDDSGGTDPEIPLDVSIDWTNGPITAGEPLCLDCTATNTGDTAGVGTVAVGLDNQADSKKNWELALAPGESGSVHVTVEQGEYREGNDANYEKKLWADTGTSRAETTVSVSEPPHLAVEVQSTNAPVEAGEKIKLTAAVENTGGQTGHETVALAAKQYVNSISNAGSIMSGGGDLDAFIDTTTKAVARGTGGDAYQIGKHERLDAVGVALDPGQSQQVTLEWDTGPTTDAVEPGEYALGVAAIPPWERDEWDGPVFGRACTDGTRNDSTVVAIQHGPMRTGRFVVEIDDVEVPGWHSVAIPSRSTEQDEYREDDDPTDWGQTTFDDLEMERGVKADDTTLYDWAEAVEEGNVDQGRKEVAVKLLDEEGNPMIQWELQEAWIKEYDPPELDASADGDVATESLTVAFDKMIRVEQ